MRLIPKSLKWRAVVCGLVVGVVLSVVLYVAAESPTGKRVVYLQFVGTPAEPFFLGRLLEDSNYPIEQALAKGQVHAGDSFDEFISQYPPDTIIDHDGYRTAQFGSPRSPLYHACGPRICGNFSGCEVRSKHGRLVFAVAYSNEYTLTRFDTLPADESATAAASYEVRVMQPIRQWVASHAAVLGVAAIARRTRPNEFPANEDQP